MILDKVVRYLSVCLVALVLDAQACASTTYLSPDALVAKLRDGGEITGSISVRVLINAIQQVAKETTPPLKGDNTLVQFTDCDIEDQTINETDQPTILHLYRKIKFSACRFAQFSIPNLLCENGIIFDNCHFSGKVLMTNFQWQNSSWFNNCQFLDSCELAIGNDLPPIFASTDLEINSCSFARTFHLKPTYPITVDCANSTFSEDAKIERQEFAAKGSLPNIIKLPALGASKFEECSFHGNCIAEHVDIFDDVTFTHCDFNGLASFERATLNSTLEFLDCDFHHDVRFDSISGKGALAFSGETTFSGISIFDNFSASELLFADDDSTNFLRSTSASKHFMSYCSLRHLSKTKLLIQEGIFEGYTDISDISSASTVSLDQCQVNGDLNFIAEDDNNYDSLSNLHITRVKFAKGVYVAYDQIFQKIPFSSLMLFSRPALAINIDSGSLSELSNATGKANIVSVSNDAKYFGETRLKSASLFDECVWGYGTRPSRLIWWAIIATLIWTGFYYLEINRLLPNTSEEAKLQQAFLFSLQCSLNPRFSWENSTTWFYKCVCLSQSVLVISLLISALYLLAKVNPLMQEIVSKIIPL